MKLDIIALTAAALSVMCCTKDITPTGDSCSDSVFSIELQTGGTKVAAGNKVDGYYPLNWQAGDAVIFNGTLLSQALGSEFDGSSKATFKIAQKIFYPVSIVYPSTAAGPEGNILIPAKQTADGSKFANGYAVMTGYSTSGGAVDMVQTCGYIKVGLTGTHTLTGVSLKALGCEILAGEFTVDAKQGKIAPVAGSTGSSSITLLTDAALSSEASYFAFAVPAGTYPKGFRLTVRDNAGQQMTKTVGTSGGKVISAGMMTEMPSLAYVPGAAEEDVFELSESKVSFSGSGFAERSVSACAGNEDVTVTMTGLDWCEVNVPATIPAGMTTNIGLEPTSANVCDVRDGTITFTGKTSGKKVELSVSQSDMYTPYYGFPAKWFKSDITAEMKETWSREGYVTCSSGAGSGRTFLSVGSAVKGRRVTPSVYSDCIAASGMVEGDFFQFSAPVQDVAALTDLDIMITIAPTAASAPKYWLVEWWDGGGWRSNPRYTASEDGSTKYSFYIKYFSSANYRTHIESITLSNPVKDDFVKVRVRAVGKWNNGGGTLSSNTAMVFLSPGTYSTYFVCYADEQTPVRDTHKMAQYGNSITYYHGSAMMLKEIARREGHQLDVRINLKGSQEFEHHLMNLPFSQEIMAEGGYDYVVMNDGSYFHAEYAAGSKSAIVGVSAKYTPEEILYWQKEMTKAAKSTSPGCQTIITSEHSYSRKAADDNYLGFGSFENFDKYQWQGSVALATADPNLDWIAPAGKGFARARSEYGFTASYNWMQHTDNYHPNLYGAYMRACITYLTMFGGSFGDNPADCCLDPSDAAKLRQAAMDIVNDSTRESFHFNK